MTVPLTIKVTFEYSYSGTLLAHSNVKDNLRKGTRRQKFFDEVPIGHLSSQSRDSIKTVENLEQGVKSVRNYQ